MANKFLDDNGVLYLWNKIKSLFVQKEDGKGLSSNDFTNAEKTKLSGIEAGANKYTHPTYTARDNGFYKVTVDGTGHVSNIKAVEKADITGLGIPEQDTTYEAATTTANGLMSSTDKKKLDGIASGATKITVDSALSSTSTNPVQNKAVNTELGKKINTSARGAKNGVASLDENGLVPSSQLPSYVDDVIEGYYSNGAFYKEAMHKTVITGETGKIYVDLTTNMSYRYGGTEYVKITSSDMVAITNAELDTICV